MPIKTSKTLPKTPRGDAASDLMPEDEVKWFEDHPGEWGLMAEDVTTGQNYSNWAKKANNDGEGPWYVTTVLHINEDGTKHIEEGTTSRGSKKGSKTMKRFVDVWVTYNPAGRPEGLRKGANA